MQIVDGKVEKGDMLLMNTKKSIVKYLWFDKHVKSKYILVIDDHF